MRHVENLTVKSRQILFVCCANDFIWFEILTFYKSGQRCTRDTFGDKNSH